MEVEHTTTGPLSYDLTVPDKDPSAQRGIILGLLVLVAAWIVAVVGGWFVLGFISDATIVHRYFPLAIVVVAVGATFLGTKSTLRRARQHALLVILAISTGAGLLAYNSLHNVKMTVPQVRRELDRIDLPAGFKVVNEETRGDRFCRHGCPRVDRTYEAPANDPDPVRTMVLAMFAQGWNNPNDIPDKDSTTALKNDIFVQLGETSPHTVQVTAARQS